MIDLTIPTALRRESTPEIKEQCRKTAFAINNRYANHVWAEPRDPAVAKEEARLAAVAKLNAYVQNRAAPVEVSYQPKGQKSAALLRRFANMDEFEAWYKPTVHHCTYAYASADQTMLFSSLPDWAIRKELSGDTSKPVKAPSVAKAPVAGAKVPATVKAPGGAPSPKGGRYVDIRHVRQMSDAGFDFNPTTNTFTKGKVSVAIAPPVSGRWSSAWEVGGKTGRGIKALLRALGQ